jgi:cation diffusion facilitator family transporter
MQNNRSDKAVKITWVGFWVNLLLSLFKVLAGILGKSAAMLADGIHSLSDFITDFIVIFFMKISSKEKDEGHKYGHGKYETFASLIISIVLIGVGIGMMYSSGEKIWQAINGAELEQPATIALIAAFISIIVKEWLYRITIKVGKEIKSDAVIANGWHHRSDAFSSIGTCLGISGAIFLGAKWRVLDPIAGLIVSFFIIRVGYMLLKPAIMELLEAALPKETENEISNIISNTNGVENCHNLKTRKCGNIYVIDVHIKVNPNISIIKAHDISTDVENNLKQKYGTNTLCSVHVEPLV